MSRPIPTPGDSLSVSFKIITAILAIIPTIEKIIPTVYSLIFFIVDAPLIKIIKNL